jgi:hypothetical protein
MALVLNDKRQLTDLLLSSVASYNIALDGSLGFGAHMKHNIATQGGERVILSMYVLEDMLKERIGVIGFNKAVAKIGAHRRVSKSYPNAMCWKVDITDVC